MPNKSEYKYLGAKKGMPYYEAPPFVVEDRTQAVIKRSPIKVLSVEKKQRRPGPSTKRTAASR